MLSFFSKKFITSSLNKFSPVASITFNNIETNTCKSLNINQSYKFSFKKEKPTDEPDEHYRDYDILDHEDEQIREKIKPKTFVQRNRWTLGCLGIAIPSLLLEWYILGLTMGVSSFFCLMSAERVPQKLTSIYYDVYGHSNIRFNNLNDLVLQFMKESNLAKELVSPHLKFYQMSLDKFTVGEKRFVSDGDQFEMMQRKYKYTAKFSDITTGAVGKVYGECSYNHDKDYYFRYLDVTFWEPAEFSINLKDNRDIYDIYDEKEEVKVGKAPKKEQNKDKK